MAYTIKIPSYINDFKCIGKDCELHCCQVWGIDWYVSEVERIKNSDCSQELKELVAHSFKKTEHDDIVRIIFGEDNDCPFHDKEDRLCMIQKELGEGYLSHICRTYPLAGTINNDTILRHRVISCPAVYDLITASPDACDIYTKARKEEITTVNGCFVDTETDVRKNPVLRYRNELFDFFYGILSNKNTDVITALISGILATSKIDEFAAKDVKRIPEVIKALTPQMTNPATLNSLKDIAPNLSVKLPVLKNLFSSLGVEMAFRKFIQSDEGSADTDVLYISPERYNECHEKFRSCFPKDFVIRNIIRSLYMDMQMPFNDKTDSVFANYVYFAVCVAAIEYLGVCIAASNDDETVIRAKFKTIVCHMGRKLCHNTTTKKIVLDFIKNINCYTPGYISIIIK